MKVNIDDCVEALEVVFDSLDTSTWEDSYVPCNFSSEPNEHVKQTVSDKKEYLWDILYDAILELEKHQSN